MAADNDYQEALKMLRLHFLIEQEKTREQQQQFNEKERQLLLELEKMREERRIIEQTKAKLEDRRKIEQEKTKLEVRRIIELKNTKRMKIQNQHALSSINTGQTLLINHRDFYDYYVDGNIDSFDINFLSNENNSFNDEITNDIENYLNDISLLSTISEAATQKAFNKLIVNLLELFNGSAALKYLTTHNSSALEGFHPVCCFIYKNVNVDYKSESNCFQHFIVCLGEVKTPDISIDSKEAIGQICQYLSTSLYVQNRRKMYGFSTNFTHITFYYVEKKPYSTTYNFYKSQNLEMFNYSSPTSSSADAITKIEQSSNKYLNKETWKIFAKFLTMNADFYQYTALTINPVDDLLGDRYEISRKLGDGATSMVYSLAKTKDSYVNNDLQNYVVKISKRSSFKELFINEINIMKQLQQSNN
ncbi:unnamed protein product [Rotaria socialis]|uniref:Protein kinase domain-containing protein n=1 Tax=Rotaria socialis TaxID=392032 RepID=A0A818D6U9_9BILA|nr:unnamed protein product [Rotaria socialis]CAF4745728.1 unnamed protein product [Rotaria socialis]